MTTLTPAEKEALAEIVVERAKRLQDEETTEVYLDYARLLLAAILAPISLPLYGLSLATTGYLYEWGKEERLWRSHLLAAFTIGIAFWLALLFGGIAR